MGRDTPVAPWRIGLSVVIPCYIDRGDHRSIHALLRTYNGYGADLLDRVEFILVDDGSPVPVELPAGIALNLRLLRVEDHIPWNQGGARNLGAVMARCERLFMTDLDHRVPEATLRHLLERRLPGRHLYKLARVDTAGQPLASHPNTLLMGRSRFLGLFGYDEEFAGHYGYEDGMFIRWQRYNGTVIGALPPGFPVVFRGAGADSGHALTRDKSRNAALRDRKKREWTAWGENGGHSRRFLAFRWRLVEDRVRPEPAWTPPRAPLWKALWWLRRLLPGRG